MCRACVDRGEVVEMLGLVDNHRGYKCDDGRQCYGYLGQGEDDGYDAFAQPHDALVPFYQGVDHIGYEPCYEEGQQHAFEPVYEQYDACNDDEGNDDAYYAVEGEGSLEVVYHCIAVS